ncbi:MAG: V-type ATPase subunit [Clostridia bacterium]|nr:V-type ATPase subunit [Clostridia bacterium]
MRDTIYSNAIASSYEGKLLGIEKLNRFVECQDEKELFRLVLESGFGVGATSIDEAIASEWKAWGDFVREYSPTADIQTYLLVKYDYLYLEQLVKSKYLSTNFPTAIYEGLYPQKTLKHAVDSGDYTSLHPIMAKLLAEVDRAFEDAPKGYEISAMFANATYQHLLTIRTPVLVKAVKYEISLKNITVALRSRGNRIVNMYIQGGDIPLSVLNQLEESIDENIVFDYKNSVYHDIFASALKCHQLSLPYVEIERMMDSKLLSILREDRLLLAGSMPFLLYCLYKQNEIKNIRIIVTGIRTNQEKSTIKERLREGYEG